MDGLEPIRYGEPGSLMLIDATSPGTPDPAWRGFGTACIESVTSVPTSHFTVGSWSSHPATGPTEVTAVPLILDMTEYRGDEMMLLEVAAGTGNAEMFARAAGQIDWAGRPAADFVRAARLALAAGAHLLARRLAELGAGRHPDHAELKEMAHILARPRVVRSDLPPDPTIRLNLEWLREHATEYQGQWVALKQGVLVAHAPTARELRARLLTTEGLFLTRVV